MPAPRKYDDSTMEQAVGMYLDRQRSHPGESKIESRRQVGALLDIHHATLRNWVEARERAEGVRPAVDASSEVVDMDEVRRMRRELTKLRRANDILKTSATFCSGGARPPTQVIVGYIDEHKDRFGIEPICAELTGLGVTIAPSTYYEKKASPVSAAVLEEAYLVNALVTLHRDNWGVYGVRKLWRAARASGFDVGRDQVARLMRVGGIRGAVRGQHRTVTTARDEQAPRHPDLVGRDWDAPTAPDQLWVADFSYVWTLAGFVYVAFVVDVYSRRILGWRVSSSKHTELVLDAFRQAMHTRHRHQFGWTTTGLVHQSDAGSQYTSVAFTQELIDTGIAGSIGTVGDALDNALMESTIGLCKT